VRSALPDKPQNASHHQDRGGGVGGPRSGEGVKTLPGSRVPKTEGQRPWGRVHLGATEGSVLSN
jgi:hypothetical protein